jgi:hypothetical protein
MGNRASAYRALRVSYQAHCRLFLTLNQMLQKYDIVHLAALRSSIPTLYFLCILHE